MFLSCLQVFVLCCERKKMLLLKVCRITSEFVLCTRQEYQVYLTVHKKALTEISCWHLLSVCVSRIFIIMCFCVMGWCSWVWYWERIYLFPYCCFIGDFSIFYHPIWYFPAGDCGASYRDLYFYVWDCDVLLGKI